VPYAYILQAFGYFFNIDGGIVPTEARLHRYW
jgi:hypothetical protein